MASEASEVLNLLSPHSSDGFYAMNNQFQKKGTKGFFEQTILNNDAFYMRIDFPGVSEENFQFSIDQEKKSVTFEGEAPQHSQHEEGGRSYVFDIFRVPCYCCQISNIKAHVKDGVVRIRLQKVKNTNLKGSDIGCGKPKLSPLGNALLDLLLTGQVSTITDGSSGDYIVYHPFVTIGSREAFESKTTANRELFLRVDMPGVAKKDVKVVVEGGEVKFFGKARKRDHDWSGREYMGSVSLLPKIDILKGKIEHEMKDGVLRMLIPPA